MGALKDNICCSSLYKCVAEMAYIFLESKALASVTTIRVEKEKKVLRHK